jgi:hypothetical protein
VRSACQGKVRRYMVQNVMRPTFFTSFNFFSSGTI